MGTKAKYIGGTATYFDSVTGELTGNDFPVQYKEDFLGAGWGAGIPAAGSAVGGLPWVKKIVGAAPPTVARVANAAGGQIACTLTSTSEKQDAAIYQDDSLTVDISKNAIFECRAKLSVLPSAAQVQMVMGLQSAWIDGPDNASFYLGFGFLGNGTILLRSKDGVTTNAISTGVAVLNTDWHFFRVDASDPTNVIFSMDGSTFVTATKIAFAATGANAITQPYASAYKASGTGVGTLTLDEIQFGANRT